MTTWVLWRAASIAIPSPPRQDGFEDVTYMRKETLIAVLAVLAVVLSCAVVMAEDAGAETSEKAVGDGEPLFAIGEDQSDDATITYKDEYYYSYGDTGRYFRIDFKIANWSASVQDEDSNWVVVDTFTGVYFYVDLSDYDLVKITRTWPGVETYIFYVIPLHLPQSGDSDGKYVVTFYDGDTVLGAPYVDRTSFLKKGDPHVQVPDDPVRDGHVFGGWFTDQSFEEQYRFDPTQPIPCDMNVYAKWTESGSGFPWWILIIVAIVVAAVAYYMYKKKTEESDS